MKNSIILSLFLFCSTLVLSQEPEEKKDFKPHKIEFVFGLTHIPEAFEEGHLEKEVYVPTLGLDYFYQLNEKWKLGYAFDVEFGEYVVDFYKENLSRENAIVTAALAGYEILPRWSVLAGPGIEFEKNKTLFIFRASTEYEFELANYWGLFPSFNYDFKEEYSTWALSFGISKRF